MGQKIRLVGQIVIGPIDPVKIPHPFFGVPNVYNYIIDNVMLMVCLAYFEDFSIYDFFFS